MKKELKDRLAEIEKVLEKVISDRKKVSRSEVECPTLRVNVDASISAAQALSFA